jgi:hypothetical protein
MYGAQGAPGAAPLAPTADAVPQLPAADGDGGNSFFRRLPKELLPRVLDRVDQRDGRCLRLCDRFTRDAVDGRGWRRLTVRRPRPFYLSSARARSF